MDCGRLNLQIADIVHRNVDTVVQWYQEWFQKGQTQRVSGRGEKMF